MFTSKYNRSYSCMKTVFFAHFLYYSYINILSLQDIHWSGKGFCRWSICNKTGCGAFKFIWSLSSDDCCAHLFVLLFHAGPSQQPERRRRRSATYATLLVGGRTCCHASSQSAACPRVLSSSVSSV